MYRLPKLFRRPPELLHGRCGALPFQLGRRGALALLVAPLVVGCSSTPKLRDTAGKPDGARIYGLYCDGCHGPDGRRGDGPMKLVTALDRPSSELRTVIENGRGGMPAWRNRLKPDEIDAVLAYVKRFP